MLAALLALPLLVAIARAHDFNTKFEATERMGLDVPLTRSLKFYIPDKLCSGVVSTALYDIDCLEPLAMLVTAQDNKLPEVTLVPGMQKATVLRKRNENHDCPGEAPVIVRVACAPSGAGGPRRVRADAEPRPLPVATDDDLYGGKDLDYVNK